MGSICLILDSSTKLQSTLSRNKKKYFLQIFQNKIFWDYFMVWSVSTNSNRSTCIFVNSFDSILYDFLENLWQGYGTFLFQAHYFIKSSKLSHTVFFFFGNENVSSLFHFYNELQLSYIRKRFLLSDVRLFFTKWFPTEHKGII